MKTRFHKILLLFTCFVYLLQVKSQVMGTPGPAKIPNLLVCKQTGQFTSLQGTDTKTTDRYERGTVKITTQGPVKYTLDPGEFSIGPNERKTWKATISPDVASAPPAGNCVSAFILAHYDVVNSRPRGFGSDGTVISTYTCSGCYAHPAGGVHEIVNKVGDVMQMFSVCSIDVKVKDIVCNPGEIILHADVVPAGGNLSWNTPFGNFAGNDVKVANPKNLLGFKVTATYLIEGLTVTDTKTVERDKLIAFTLPCCSDKPIIIKDVAQLQFTGPCRPDVVFTPPILDIPADVPDRTEYVFATADGVRKRAVILMVNSQRKIADKVQGPDIAGNIKQTIEAWRKKTANVIKIASNSGVAPCKPKGNSIPKVIFAVEGNALCCPPDKNGCVKWGKKFSGDAKWSYGVNCHFPVYGIPYVATLDAVLSASVSGAIQLNGQFNCAETKVCAQAEVKASIGGGVGGTLLSGAVSADLQLVVDGIGVTGELCFYPLPLKGCAKVTLGKLKIVGNVTVAWGLVSNTVEYTICQGKEYGPWCYPN